MFNKILTIAFIILLIILLGEVGYLFFLQNQVKTDSISNVKIDQNLIKSANNRSVKELVRYVSDLKQNPKKLYYSNTYEGYLDSVKFLEDNEITMLVKDKKGQIIENYRNFPISYFHVYQKNGDNLEKIALQEKIYDGKKVMVKEFDPVLKNGQEDAGSGFIEIIVE